MRAKNRDYVCVPSYEMNQLMSMKRQSSVQFGFQICKTNSSRHRQMSAQSLVTRRRYAVDLLRHFRRRMSRGTKMAGCCSCRRERACFRRKCRHRATCVLPTSSWMMTVDTCVWLRTTSPAELGCLHSQPHSPCSVRLLSSGPKWPRGQNFRPWPRLWPCSIRPRPRPRLHSSLASLTSPVRQYM